MIRRSFTVAQYLDEWLSTAIKPRRAANTYNLYAGTIKNHLKKAFGDIPLQKLSPRHIERYYAESTLAPASMKVHHAILTTALKAAVLKGGMVESNVAARVANKPCSAADGDVLTNVWGPDEAKRFLTTVKASGNEQDAALFALALDSGARKGELLGLKWSDLDGNKLKIERQLGQGGTKVGEDGTTKEPTFIPPKRGGVRSVDLSDETVLLLQAHKRKQAEVKMANRTRYRDHGLIFARAWEQMSSQNSLLGAPLSVMAMNTLLASLCTTAGVREITPHGLRHTCATLLLSAKVQPHIVQRRLGHKKVEMTLNIYAHAIPSMQKEAANQLATLLHG